MAWTGQGGAPLELNDLEADRAICSIRWEERRDKNITIRSTDIDKSLKK